MKPRHRGKSRSSARECTRGSDPALSHPHRSRLLPNTRARMETPLDPPPHLRAKLGRLFLPPISAEIPLRRARAHPNHRRHPQGSAARAGRAGHRRRSFRADRGVCAWCDRRRSRARHRGKSGSSARECTRGSDPALSHPHRSRLLPNTRARMETPLDPSPLLRAKLGRLFLLSLIPYSLRARGNSARAG
jgi:hypothetical protein